MRSASPRAWLRSRTGATSLGDESARPSRSRSYCDIPATAGARVRSRQPVRWWMAPFCTSPAKCDRLARAVAAERAACWHADLHLARQMMGEAGPSAGQARAHVKYALAPRQGRKRLPAALRPSFRFAATIACCGKAPFITGAGPRARAQTCDNARPATSPI
jgi:hypothetical protein